MQWLALAQSEILHGLILVRHIQRGSRKGDIAEAKALGESALVLMERELATNEWLARSLPTIADIACYPHVARASESDYEIERYPAVCDWLRRIEALPRWVPRLQRMDDPATANLHANRPWP